MQTLLTTLLAAVAIGGFAAGNGPVVTPSPPSAVSDEETPLTALREALDRAEEEEGGFRTIFSKRRPKVVVFPHFLKSDETDQLSRLTQFLEDELGYADELEDRGFDVVLSETVDEELRILRGGPANYYEGVDIPTLLRPLGCEYGITVTASYDSRDREVGIDLTLWTAWDESFRGRSKGPFGNRNDLQRDWQIVKDERNDVDTRNRVGRNADHGELVRGGKLTRDQMALIDEAQETYYADRRAARNLVTFAMQLMLDEVEPHFEAYDPANVTLVGLDPTLEQTAWEVLDRRWGKNEDFQYQILQAAVKNSFLPPNGLTPARQSELGHLAQALQRDGFAVFTLTSLDGKTFDAHVEHAAGGAGRAQRGPKLVSNSYMVPMLLADPVDGNDAERANALVQGGLQRLVMGLPHQDWLQLKSAPNIELDLLLTNRNQQLHEQFTNLLAQLWQAGFKIKRTHELGSADEALSSPKYPVTLAVPGVAGSPAVERKFATWVEAAGALKNAMHSLIISDDSLQRDRLLTDTALDDLLETYGADVRLSSMLYAPRELDAVDPRDMSSLSGPASQFLFMFQADSFVKLEARLVGEEGRYKLELHCMDYTDGTRELWSHSQVFTGEAAELIHQEFGRGEGGTDSAKLAQQFLNQMRG